MTKEQIIANIVHDIVKTSIFASLNEEEVTKDYLELKHDIYKKIDLEKITETMNNMKTYDPKYKSECCGAKVFTSGMGDFHDKDTPCTMHYICDKCKKACNIVGMKQQNWEKEFIEYGANLEHNRWSGWQEYLHSLCIKNDDESLTIPKERVFRWSRQIDTPYKDLSEAEKVSDRKEVQGYLNYIKQNFIPKSEIKETLKEIIR